MKSDGGSESEDASTETEPERGIGAVVKMVRDSDESVYRPWAEISLLLLVVCGLLLVGVIVD